jgi:hypothetical protein
LGLEIRQRYESKTVPEDTEAFHVSQQRPMGTKILGYKPRDLNDHSLNPTDNVLHHNGNRDDRRIKHSERDYESPQKHVEETTGLIQSTKMGTRLKDPVYNDGTKNNIEDNFEAVGQPIRMGTRIKDVDYHNNQQQIESEIQGNVKSDQRGIKIRDRDYENQNGNRVNQISMEPVQDFNNPSNPRLRNQNPRIITQRPRATVETIQDTNSTKYTILRETAPRPRAPLANKELLHDANADFDQR